MTYSIATNLQDAFLIHDIVRYTDKQRLFVEGSQPNQLRRSLSISSADYGGLTLNIAAVRHNRFYTDQVQLDVPYLNKQLNISFETFRDKTLPGSQEKWKIKVSGYKTDRVAAELLTAMYDASLDQFKSHSWQAPAIWQKRITTTHWNGQHHFFSVFQIS